MSTAGAWGGSTNLSPRGPSPPPHKVGIRGNKIFMRGKKFWTPSGEKNSGPHPGKKNGIRKNTSTILVIPFVWNSKTLRFIIAVELQPKFCDGEQKTWNRKHKEKYHFWKHEGSSSHAMIFTKIWVARGVLTFSLICLPRCFNLCVNQCGFQSLQRVNRTKPKSVQ